MIAITLKAEQLYKLDFEVDKFYDLVDILPLRDN